MAAKGAKLQSIFTNVDEPLVRECSVPGCQEQFKITLYPHLNRGQNPELKCKTHLTKLYGKRCIPKNLWRT